MTTPKDGGPHMHEWYAIEDGFSVCNGCSAITNVPPAPPSPIPAEERMASLRSSHTPAPEDYAPAEPLPTSSATGDPHGEYTSPAEGGALRGDGNAVLDSVSRNAMDQIAALRARAEAAEARAASLFKAIAHGDEKHRAWLKQAIGDHFTGRPVLRPDATAAPAQVRKQQNVASAQPFETCPEEGCVLDVGHAGACDTDIPDSPAPAQPPCTCGSKHGELSHVPPCPRAAPAQPEAQVATKDDVYKAYRRGHEVGMKDGAEEAQDPAQPEAQGACEATIGFGGGMLRCGLPSGHSGVHKDNRTPAVPAQPPEEETPKKYLKAPAAPENRPAQPDGWCSHGAQAHPCALPRLAAAEKRIAELEIENKALNESLNGEVSKALRQQIVNATHADDLLRECEPFLESFRTELATGGNSSSGLNDLCRRLAARSEGKGDGET